MGRCHQRGLRTELSLPQVTPQNKTEKQQKHTEEVNLLPFIVQKKKKAMAASSWLPKVPVHPGKDVAGSERITGEKIKFFPPVCLQLVERERPADPQVHM